MPLAEQLTKDVRYVATMHKNVVMVVVVAAMASVVVDVVITKMEIVVLEAIVKNVTANQNAIHVHQKTTTKMVIGVNSSNKTLN